MLRAITRTARRLPASVRMSHTWRPAEHPYPFARRSDASSVYQSERLGQVSVPEPYDWLETPPSQSAETAKWVREQAAYTSNFVSQCPHAPELHKRIEANFSYARMSAPSRKADGRYYYTYNPGLLPQPQVWRATREQLDDAQARHARGELREPFGEVFMDTNLFSQDGTVALTLLAFSHTGKYVAYGLSTSGSDWFKVYVRTTDAPVTSADDRMPDVLDNVKFSNLSWTHDDAGFFYQQYPAVATEDRGTDMDASTDARLFYHRLGTPQTEDVVVIDADAKTPSSMWFTRVTDDGKWLFVENSKDTDTKQRYYLAPLAQGVSAHMHWLAISSAFEYTLSYLANDESRFYFLTNSNASNYRVVYVDVDETQASLVAHVADLQGSVKMYDVVSEDPEALLSDATVVDANKLLLVYSRDVKDELWLHDLSTGRRIERLLPELVGTITQISGRRVDREVNVAHMSFINPGVTERLSWESTPEGAAVPPATTATLTATHVPGIRTSDFVTTQVFFESRDGTRVPMFITHARDMPIDGSAPALVYFYGGFNIPLSPMFSPSMMTWAASYRGALVFVNARGGGEYGDKWHKAGALLNKQNVFDDVMAACMWLHKNGYAKKGKIIINGGSNGGLGVAAVTNQAEEEHGIGAAIADVGVHDMLKFADWTIGRAWSSDYGSPQSDPTMFDYNYAYSPLHNVDENKVYPTVVLACADHDDRVVPAHSFKLAAELQHRLANNPNPLLLRVEIDAGHGAGKSTQKRIAEASEKYAIVARMLGLELFPRASRV